MIFKTEKIKLVKYRFFCRQVIPAGSFCNSNEPKSGLARDLGDCLQSRNVPFGTSGDCELMTGILLLKKDKIFVQK